MNKKEAKSGFVFTKHTPKEQSPFDKLFDVFQELIVHTSGDFDEAMDWLKQLDDEYGLTTDDYSLDDFVEDLKKKGYLREALKIDGTKGLAISEKTERAIRKRDLEQIFAKLRKSGAGTHRTKQTGKSKEQDGDTRDH